MTKPEAKQMFIGLCGKALIQHWQTTDKPALRQAWNEHTDALCKDGEITQRQYDTWTNPFIKK